MNSIIEIGNNYAESYPLYEYLKYNVLPCKYNFQYFREKVKEMYLELLCSMDIQEPEDGELFPILMPTPSVEAVADKIYSNCIATIVVTMKEMGASDEMVEHIRMVFDHDAGADIEYDVADVLWTDGYPSPSFKEGSPFQQRQMNLRSKNPLQVQVLKGWC